MCRGSRQPWRARVTSSSAGSRELQRFLRQIEPLSVQENHFLHGLLGRPAVQPTVSPAVSAFQPGTGTSVRTHPQVWTRSQIPPHCRVTHNPAVVLGNREPLGGGNEAEGTPPRRRYGTQTTPPEGYYPSRPHAPTEHFRGVVQCAAEEIHC